MNSPQLRSFKAGDETAILALNAQSVQVLSPMNAARFSDLKAQSDCLLVAEVDGKVVGFLIGFCDGKTYDSLNYQWFRSRLKNFFYIDRIVIDENARSQGLGKLFYQHLIKWAGQNAITWLAAEIDIDPPNPGSLAFHVNLGFSEVAQQTLSNKTVSLQVMSL